MRIFRRESGKPETRKPLKKDAKHATDAKHGKSVINGQKIKETKNRRTEGHREHESRSFPENPALRPRKLRRHIRQTGSPPEIPAFRRVRFGKLSGLFSLSRKFFRLSGFALLLWSCGLVTTPLLETQTFFTLPLGYLPDNIHPLTLNSSFYPGVSYDISDNFFYVSDQNNRKIMKFSAYGTLSLLLYSPKQAPYLSRVQEKGRLNIRLKPWDPPGEIRQIAAENTAFFVEVIGSPQDKASVSPEENRSLLVFDTKGNRRRVIRRKGGRLFPYMETIRPLHDGRLLVISRRRNQRLVDFFSPAPDYTPLKSYVISPQTFPALRLTEPNGAEQKTPEGSPSAPSGESLLPEKEKETKTIRQIIPDADGKYFYVLRDTLPLPFNQNMDSRPLSPPQEKQTLYRLTFPSSSEGALRYEKLFDLPEDVSPGARGETKYYSLRGITPRKKFFFLSYVGDNQYEINLFDKKGRQRGTSFLEIPRDTSSIHFRYYSERNTLTAMGFFPSGVRFLKWKEEVF